MKKRIISGLLLYGLLASTNIGLAIGAGTPGSGAAQAISGSHYPSAQHAGYGTALVDGANANRVHLREGPSAASASLGLYFTGTEVLCDSDPSQEWVAVTVGRQSGYIKSQFLCRGDDTSRIQSKQPRAVVNNKQDGGWLNLRQEPSLDAAVLGRLYHGDGVSVLGETVTQWYYVKAGDLYGYVMSDYLLFGGSTPQGYEMLLYTAAPNQYSDIQIRYPRFTGAGLDWLNALIEEKVQGFAQSGISAYGRDTGLSLDYQSAVTLQNSKIVSLVFWGSSNIQGSLHPFTDLIPYTIDLASRTEVSFADLYSTNGGFQKVFFQKAFFPVNPVTSYDAASFPEMLKLQTTESKTFNPFGFSDGVSFFLKPDGIVISLSAIHATGSDHFEAQIRYSDIQQFYRLKQKYWEDR